MKDPKCLVSQKYKYCLKYDDEIFYPTIHHELLNRLIRLRIKDKEILNLIDDIIDQP